MEPKVAAHYEKVPAVEKKITREIHFVSIVSPRVQWDQVQMETLAHVYCFSGYSLEDKTQ